MDTLCLCNLRLLKAAFPLGWLSELGIQAKTIHCIFFRLVCRANRGKKSEMKSLLGNYPPAALTKGPGVSHTVLMDLPGKGKQKRFHGWVGRWWAWEQEEFGGGWERQGRKVLG